MSNVIVNFIIFKKSTMQVIVTIFTRWACMLSIPVILILYFSKNMEIIEHLSPSILSVFAFLVTRSFILPAGMPLIELISKIRLVSFIESTFPRRYRMFYLISTHIVTIPLSMLLYRGLLYSDTLFIILYVPGILLLMYTYSSICHDTLNRGMFLKFLYYLMFTGLYIEPKPPHDGWIRATLRTSYAMKGVCKGHTWHLHIFHPLWPYHKIMDTMDLLRNEERNITHGAFLSLFYHQRFWIYTGSHWVSL
jgi:hypothetical protein